MKDSLLPAYWKKIALGIFVLTLAAWFISLANPDLINVDPYILNWILKIVILFSLLLYISTKEEVETERIARLRLKCLFSAITVGVFLLMLEVFMEISFQGENAEVTSGYELMMIILVVYYLSFYIKKNLKTVKRG